MKYINQVLTIEYSPSFGEIGYGLSHQFLDCIVVVVRREIRKISELELLLVRMWH